MTLYRVTAAEDGMVFVASSGPRWDRAIDSVRTFARNYPSATIAVSNTEHDCAINDGLTSAQRAEVAEAVRSARSN